MYQRNYSRSIAEYQNFDTSVQSADAKEFFDQELVETVKLINGMRRINQFTKLVMGYVIAFLLMGSTLGTFCLLAQVFNPVLLGSIVIMVLAWIGLVALIYYPSEIRLTFIGRSEQLRRLSMKIKWTPSEQYRINRILVGMDHLNSFSAFDLIQPIHHHLIILVSSTLRDTL